MFGFGFGLEFTGTWVLIEQRGHNHTNLELKNLFCLCTKFHASITKTTISAEPVLYSLMKLHTKAWSSKLTKLVNGSLGYTNDS